jgi:hypothetical protein
MQPGVTLFQCKAVKTGDGDFAAASSSGPSTRASSLTARRREHMSTMEFVSYLEIGGMGKCMRPPTAEVTLFPLLVQRFSDVLNFD